MGKIERVRMKVYGMFPPILLALLVGLLFGCQGLPQESPSPTVSVEPIPTVVVKPCPLPCWYGITPGKTSFEEALNLVRSLPGAYDVEVSDAGKRLGGKAGTMEIYWKRGYSKEWWYCSKCADAQNFLVAEEGVVTRIHLELALTDTLTLGEVIERYGPPEGYETYYIMGYHADEADQWCIILFYPQMGMTVSVHAPAEQRYGDVTADLEVTGLYLYLPITMEEYYQQIQQPYPDPCLKEWQGFHQGEKPCPAP